MLKPMPASFLPQSAASSGLSAPSVSSCAARLHPSSFSCPPGLPEYRLKIAAEQADAAFCEPSLWLFPAELDCSLHTRPGFTAATLRWCKCQSYIFPLSSLRKDQNLWLSQQSQTLCQSGCWPTAAACLDFAAPLAPPHAARLCPLSSSCPQVSLHTELVAEPPSSQSDIP